MSFENHRATLKALVVTVSPPAAFVDAAFLERVLGEVFTSLDYMPPENHGALKAGLTAFECGPWILGPAHRRFSLLRAGERRRYAEKWADNRFVLFRDFFKAMKALVILAYYDQPEVWEHIEYAPQAYVDALKAADGDRD